MVNTVNGGAIAPLAPPPRYATAYGDFLSGSYLTLIPLICFSDCRTNYQWYRLLLASLQCRRFVYGMTVLYHLQKKILFSLESKMSSLPKLIGT